MRWTKRLAVLAVIASVAAAAITVQAQTRRPPAEVQKDFEQFVARFAAALKADDRAAVTEMTKFPFYVREMRNAEYFNKNIYGKLRTARIRDCIARGRGDYSGPDHEGRHHFTVYCGQELFSFATSPAGFRFVETGPIPAR